MGNIDCKGKSSSPFMKFGRVEIPEQTSHFLCGKGSADFLSYRRQGIYFWILEKRNLAEISRRSQELDYHYDCLSACLLIRWLFESQIMNCRKTEKKKKQWAQSGVPGCSSDKIGYGCFHVWEGPVCCIGLYQRKNIFCSLFAVRMVPLRL